MNFVTEYEAWLRPGRVVSRDHGKEIQAHVWACGIPRDVFIGTSNIPDESDVVTLARLLEKAPERLAEFNSFCEQHDIAPDIADERAACQFLEYLNGACVAWIHLPVGPDQDALLARIREVADQLELDVRGPV